jgi:hypothetical protein
MRSKRGHAAVHLPFIYVSGTRLTPRFLGGRRTFRTVDVMVYPPLTQMLIGLD